MIMTSEHKKNAHAGIFLPLTETLYTVVEFHFYAHRVQLRENASISY
jgi:hypothetical protein